MSTSVENAAKFLSKAQQRFKENGFTWKEDVPSFNFPVKGVAKRSRFELTKFGFAEYYFVFGEAPSLDEYSLREFSAKSFELALKLKSVPLPRGFFSSVWCYPVVITEQVSETLAHAVQSEAPKKHWSAAEVPVVYESATGRLYYFEKTPLWGAAYYAGFRKMIQQYLG